MIISHDYHVHSTYSDGSLLPRMLAAAERAGLDGVGVADHCTVADREAAVSRRHRFGFNLDLTYERRRDGIDSCRDDFDLAVYDAVELDYDPRDEPDIAAFLDDAGFDYAIGSVHGVDGVNVHDVGHFAGRPEPERRAAVETYFDRLVALVDAELFEIAAHPDLVERNPALRGLASRADYDRAAAAFAGSRTVPELNAGRVLDEYGEFHPAPPFVDALRERGVPLTVGTDAHTPDVVGDRLAALEARFDELGLAPATVVG